MTSAAGSPLSAANASAEPGVAGAARPKEVSDFSEIIDAHLDFIWRLLRRLGLSSADADDAAQHVFMLAEGKLAQVTPGKERTFLYGMAVRVAANVRRRASRRRELSEAVLPPNPSLGPEPDQLLELQRARSLLDELVAELPEELRRVLLLADMEGYTVAAIAELEEIPIGTAGSRLRRARERFRELLARESHRNPFGGSP